MRLIVFLFSFAIVMPHVSAGETPSQLAYRVNLNSLSDTLDVTVCPAANLPPLSLTTDSALSWSYINDHNGTFTSDKQTLTMPGNLGCLRYQVNLNKAREARQARKVTNSWLLNNRSWLWRPARPHTMYFEFTVDGRSETVSVPYLPAGKGYIGGMTPGGWTGRIAIGGISESVLTVGSQSIRVGYVGVPQQKQPELDEWLKEAALSVSSIYGRFPVDQAQILVISIGRRKEPVPWAEVQRAGMPSAHFFIDPTRPLREFRRDWTAVHELSHLLLPKMNYDDRWAYEGLASYYQNVARSLFGMLSPQQAWSELTRGFTKGRIVQSGSLETGRSTRYQYWGGAAIYLLADIRLRALDRPTTLAQVLEILQREYFPVYQQWNAAELMGTLDTISNSRVFTDLLNNEVKAEQFPVSKSWETNDPALLRFKSDIFHPRTAQPQVIIDKSPAN